MSRPISDPVFDIGRDLQRAYDEGYKQGRYDEKVAAIDALKEHRALYCDNTPDTFSKLSYAEKSRVDELDTAIATLVNLPSAEPEQKKGEWTTEQVAELLANLFGDECSCNFSGIDEWLPYACKYSETTCPEPKEKHGCWMQFLLQGGADMRGEDNE